MALYLPLPLLYLSESEFVIVHESPIFLPGDGSVVIRVELPKQHGPIFVTTVFFDRLNLSVRITSLLSFVDN